MSSPSSILLPHTGAMRWITHAALSPDLSTATARLSISPSHPFVRDGFLLRSALIELLAQTAAAGSLLQAATAGRRLTRGLLAAIPEYTILQDIPTDTSLLLTAIHEKSLGPLTQTRLTAHLDQSHVLLAHARMTFHLTFE